MEKFQKINFKVVSRDESTNTSVFTWEPLARGMAITLGNALRRTLLSCVYGASVFGYRLNNAKHQYIALDGIVEHLCKITLNLKRLVLKINPEIISFDEHCVLTFKVEKYSGQITGKDLVCPTGVEVLSKDLVIATVNNQDIDFEVFACLGRGFKTTSENKKQSLFTELIMTDSVFSPVLNVKYEQQRLPGSFDDSEQLTMTVKTTGSVDPEEAIAVASHVLTEHLKFFTNIKIFIQSIIEEKKKEAPVKKEIMIYDLALSLRSFNCLRKAGINTVQELISYDVSEIKKINNLGVKSWKEIASKVKELNLSFKGN